MKILKAIQFSAYIITLISTILFLISMFGIVWFSDMTIMWLKIMTTCILVIIICWFIIGVFEDDLSGKFKKY